MKLDILAFGVHPDDVELSCAGTLLMEMKHGKKAGIIDLTRGELGTRGTAETRKQEADAAAKILGIQIRENLGMRDGFFKNDEEHQLMVIQRIRQYQPEIVLCNALSDRHPDHGRSAKLVADSCFLSGLRKIQTISEGKEQEAWKPKYVFHYIQDRYAEPDFIYDISMVFEQKMESVRAYLTQFNSAGDAEPQTYISTPAYFDTIISRHKMFGKRIGVEYGEGFISEKRIGISNFDGLIQIVT
jgi:bacillithiol biosynthesis deacetylase BshB1